MEYRVSGSDLLLPITPRELDLTAAFDCGQCFRFRQGADGIFSGAARGRELFLSQTEDAICFHGVSPADFTELWREWLDLDTDYEAIKAFLAAEDETMAKAVAFAPGIRILRQEPFEALISFLISQNNNIPRIRTGIERLCRAFGTPIRDGFFAFPTVETLAALEPAALSSLGLGYRDKYILDCAQRVRDGRLNLTALAALPLSEAREALLTVKGVGVKVAECALLFGFHRLDAFPVDTWMKKALAEFYPGGFPERFASVAGIAQQYLFHYTRSARVKNAAGKR